MNWLRIFFASMVLATAAGCTSSTEFGDCVGIGDDKNPALVYKLSVWNTFLAVFVSELIVPPIVVLANETFCPVGKKSAKAPA